MHPTSPVLHALARRYERSVAGRTGDAVRDVLVKVEELLQDAKADEGNARAVAEQQLLEAEQTGIQMGIADLCLEDQPFAAHVCFASGDGDSIML